MQDLGTACEPDSHNDPSIAIHGDLSMSTAQKPVTQAADPATFELCDAEGPIPTFPPRTTDARGRLVPISAEERQERSRAIIRTLKAIETLPDDPPGTTEEMMRGIDANRPDGAKLFEGMY